VYITRVYVTRGIKMASRDADGLADPFLIISNGRAKHNIIDDVKHTQLDTLNPNFYRCYELPTMIPGNPTLTIEVWDKDAHGAQLIGSTSIDLESRLLSQEWLEMVPKPVERRYLWSPASLAPQGKVEMWVEVLTPQQALASKPKVLRAPSALECELRVVVWSVVELEVSGKSKAIQTSGAANAFVTVQAGHGQLQESDVHEGVVDHAAFNWRYLFDVQQPTRHSKLTVQVWDTRSTGANDFLAECVLQLHELYDNVQKAHRLHEVQRQFYSLSHPLYNGQQGKIDMSIFIMPRNVAEEVDNIAGIGRGSPNQHPFLPPPDRSSQLGKKASLVRRLSTKKGPGQGEELGFGGALRSSNVGTTRAPGDAADDPPASPSLPTWAAAPTVKERRKEAKQRKQASRSAGDGLSVEVGDGGAPVARGKSSLFAKLRGRTSAAKAGAEYPQAAAVSAADTAADPALKL